ncbi:MAG: hypothetical protein J6K62_05055, partial [Clostridia bacterium]|nr:hypothetical protein [Clostridia bacterium]
LHARIPTQTHNFSRLYIDFQEIIGYNENTDFALFMTIFAIFVPFFDIFLGGRHAAEIQHRT